MCVGALLVVCSFGYLCVCICVCVHMHVYVLGCQRSKLGFVIQVQFTWLMREFQVGLELAEQARLVGH